MSIQFSLLSVVSTALLLLFCVADDEVILDGIEVDFSLSSARLALDIHPTWVVWVSKEYVSGYGSGCNAFARGNVIVIGEHLRESVYGDYVLAHERMHLNQFRALGLLTWPAQFVLPIELPKHITTNWNDPTQPERTMWKPPDWWPFQWSFITIKLDIN